MLLGSLFLAATLHGSVVPVAPQASTSGSITLTTSAWRVRVLVDGVPPGATVSVSGEDGVPIVFGGGWSPTVAGPHVTVTSDSSFTVAVLASIPDIEEASCFVDVACVDDPVVQRVAGAIAGYSFISGTEVVLCTGALIADRPHSGTPYFLTAAHCVTSDAEAATVEVIWDDRALSCGGPPPSLGTLPRSLGSTIVVRSEESDVALLRLRDVPGARAFLGWTTAPLPDGAILRRISSPTGAPLKFSETRVDEQGASCPLFYFPRFIHSRPVTGSTAAGSSGAPAWIGDGVIVGQLATHCAALPNATPCLPGNETLDGAFAASFGVLEPFLDPPHPRRRAVRR